MRADDFRTWSDASGKFKIEAKFIAVEDDKAILLNKEGKRLAIPLAKLSEKDRGYLEAKMGESPFEVIGDATKTKTPSNTPAASSAPKNSGATGTSPDKNASTAPTKPKELEVDFQSADPQTVLVGSWSVKPDILDAPAPKFKP
ncbi:MAG: SHD1 domain-containing protein, partial [Pirellula staleyi]